MVYCLTVGDSEFTDFWHGTSQLQMSSKIRDGSMRAQNFAPKIADVQLTTDWLIDWLSMVLRLRQHNIGYTADGFYRSDDPTNSVKALKEGG